MLLATILFGACAGASAGGGDGAPGDGSDAAPAGGADADPSVPRPDGSMGGGADAGFDGAPGECNLVTQAGCSEPTPACDLGAGNTHACRAVTAPGTTTSTCNDATACAAGLSCVRASATQSSCLEFCGSDPDCGGGAGALCAITLVDGTQTPIPGVKLCSQSCSPLDGSGCPATWGCRIAREKAGQMRPFTDCTPAGAGGKGATCSSTSDCQAGFQCLCTDQACTPALLKCFKLCNATDNLGCPAGVTCQGFGGVVIGGKAWGSCP